MKSITKCQNIFEFGLFVNVLHKGFIFTNANDCDVIYGICLFVSCLLFKVNEDLRGNVEKYLL